MNILFVIDHLGPAGAQGQIVTLGTTLKKRGHSVEFFIYYPHLDHFKPVLDETGIPVHVRSKRSRFDLTPPLDLRSLVKAGEFDVSVSFLTTPNIYNVLAALGTPTRTIVSERSAFPFAKVPASIRTRFAMYRLADHVVVNSRHQHQRLCAEFPWMKDKSSAITNGVDLDRFALPRNASRTESPQGGAEHPPDDRTAQEAAGSESGGRLLAVGSIHSSKNFRRLIEALRLYSSRYAEPLSIAWAGREPTKPGDIAEYEAAKDDLVRFGLESQWEWLGVRDDIPDLLHQFDAFIHPSLFEGLPNAVCEALAAGAPVLASNVCDHPWLVGDDERGLLFDPLDPDDIAAAIRRFMVMPLDKRERMSRNARAFAEARLSVDVYVDSFEQLFGSLD